MAHLRRAQGLIRKAYATIQGYGREASAPWIKGAIAHIRRFNRIRVKAFEDFIKDEIKKSTVCQEDRTIVRKPGNPMVRGHGTRKPVEVNENVPTQLRLV